MNTVRISLERPDQPEVLALIDALDDYQSALYPPESHYVVDLPALLQPHVLFAVARGDDGRALGCAGVMLGTPYGELKRMFVRPEARGLGVARRLVHFLEGHTATRGCLLLRLETGIHQHDALRFYEGAGYVRCERYGDYPEDPLSVYMEKHLTAVRA